MFPERWERLATTGMLRGKDRIPAGPFSSSQRSKNVWILFVVWSKLRENWRGVYKRVRQFFLLSSIKQPAILIPLSIHLFRPCTRIAVFGLVLQ